MSENPIEKSPQLFARLGGALYLIIIALGLYGEMFIRDRVIASGDAAVTAANLRAMESLWRLGLAAEFFLVTCSIVLAVILFALLRPVNQYVALLAFSFNLVSLAVEAANDLNLLAALFPLGNASYLKALQSEQLNAMTSLSLKLFGYGFGMALIFFAGACVAYGYLIFKSGYMAKLVGVLMVIAGAGYFLNGFTMLLAPATADRTSLAFLIPSFIGELSFCLWLLFKGVRLAQWMALVNPKSKGQ